MDVVPVPLFPEDVKMVNTAQTVPSTGHIKWADEQMDTDHGGHQAGGHGGGALDRGGFGDGHRESVGWRRSISSGITDLVKYYK